MGSLERKLQRNKEKQAKKDMKSKMGLFDKLGDECLACRAPYDKKDKEQVQSWFVTVRREEGVVNLYCPECWGKAQKVIEDFEKDFKKENFSVDN
jgi:hypothetical protein|tara:strand:+ start:22990 stop:23274 length:285 start_codon:yes stop_codon:yes gene_type:complete